MCSKQLACILRSGLLSQAEKQLSDMHKEKAAWLKLQKAQQAQVISLMTFLLIHASCKDWHLQIAVREHHHLHPCVADMFMVANVIMAQQMQLVALGAD